MEAVRRYVFPVIWMVILALIAAALVKMAFFGDGAAGEPAGGEVTPTAEVDPYAMAAATRGDISSVLTLPATVQPDASAPMRAASGGEVTVLYVKDGDHVEQGDKVLEVRAPSPLTSTRRCARGPPGPSRA